MEYLFVYGTLLTKANNAMTEFLKLNAEFVGRGYFHGRLYNTGEYPGAVLSRMRREKVYGSVYRLPNPENILEVLDTYEEVGRQYPEPNEYKRQKITTFLNTKKELTCWAYLYNRPVDNLEQIPSGDYQGIQNQG